MPLTKSRPDSQALSQDIRPVATASHVSGSVSTTFGGVPRRWVVPSMHWTAPNGGTRTSTLRPGARAPSSSRVKRTALASVAPLVSPASWMSVGWAHSDETMT